MTHEEIVSLIQESTDSVFSTMLGLEVSPGRSGISQGTVAPSHGVAALVSMAGSWVGIGSIDCSAPLACHFAGSMWGSESRSVDDDVLDAIGEVANMIIGNIKTSVESVVGPMELSIPTVVYGHNFITRSQRHGLWNVVPFTCCGQEFTVQVMLVPGGSHSGHSAALGQTVHQTMS
jgi:chemotaxis protein CheX